MLPLAPWNVGQQQPPPPPQQPVSQSQPSPLRMTLMVCLL